MPWQLHDTANFQQNTAIRPRLWITDNRTKEALADVGATRNTRRGIAACQAVVIAASGCLLGVAVGMVPGIASTWPLTTRILNEVPGQMTTQSPTIVIPWLPLVAVCVAVPLLAGGLAWIAVRRHPQVTRRLA